jgi:hypothetical protein
MGGILVLGSPRNLLLGRLQENLNMEGDVEIQVESTELDKLKGLVEYESGEC